MAFSNSRVAWVNKSTSNIPVYEKTVSSPGHTGGVTVGGKQVGTIFPNEFYTLIPNPENPPFTVNYITSYKIVFRDGSGRKTTGSIETSPGVTLGYYSWVSKQEPYHYYNSNGSGLVFSAKETIGGTTYRIFTVKKAVGYLDSSGAYKGTLAVGTKLATYTSTTGVSNNGHMLFYKKKTGSSWVNLVSGGSSTYGFVDLGLSKGAMPNDRAIY